MNKPVRIYSFANPIDSAFAQASKLGTWSSGKLCKECQVTTEERIQPLIIEWEPNSDVIGDFTWPGIAAFGGEDIIVTNRVRKCFEEKEFKGFEFGSVKMIQNPKLKRPIRITKRTKSRVWLPYEGQPLWDLWVTKWCHLNAKQSGIKISKKCSICGRIFYSAPKEKHYIIDPKTWPGEAIFKVCERPYFIFLIEEVKKTIEEYSFTNVTFKEMGIVGSDIHRRQLE